jgi:hypothetical protein
MSICSIFTPLPSSLPSIALRRFGLHNSRVPMDRNPLATPFTLLRPSRPKARVLERNCSSQSAAEIKEIERGRIRSASASLIGFFKRILRRIATVAPVDPRHSVSVSAKQLAVCDNLVITSHRDKLKHGETGETGYIENKPVRTHSNLLIPISSGSNPGSPTNPLNNLHAVFELPRKPCVDDFGSTVVLRVANPYACRCSTSVFVWCLCFANPPGPNPS